MIKVAIAFSSKDQVELSRQTVAHLLHPTKFDLWWVDGSITEEGKELPTHYYCRPYVCFGGADSAIAWKLSTLLAAPQNYEFIGLAENDVLLQDGWFEETMALFEKGKADGLLVGAVSPRSYVDRILIQRDGYAVMANIGAGFIIFTREAAEIVLRTFRTHWWPDNVRLFAQLAGTDLRTYAAFRGNDQFVTTDWGFEAQLARCGLASVALTPAKVQMIGQNPPLAAQGLELVTYCGSAMKHDPSFRKYTACLDNIRKGRYVPESPGMIHRDGASMLFFPHQMKTIPSTLWFGAQELQWSQGFGPFAYRAGEGGMSLSVHISGPCSFLVTGGISGVGITIEDRRSGFKTSPALPPDSGQPISIQVPGGPVPRQVTIDFEQGAVFYGLLCSEPQMIDTNFKFDWSQLPKAV